jgi:threonine 3-dehydrogenase
MYSTWNAMSRFLKSGELNPGPVITHRFPLEGIGEAVEVIKGGQAGKVILEIGT